MAQFCSQKLEEYQKLLHLHESTMLAFCVLNLAFSFLATVENLIVIHALWKSSSIPANLKKLFVNLAFSDLAVGFFAQLMLGIIMAVMVKIAANENYNFDFLCPTILTVCYSVIYFLTCVSFLTITAIAIDRFLVIFLHLRYQELVTSERVTIVLVCLWLASALAVFLFCLLPNHNSIFVAVIEICGLLLATMAYIYIFKVIRYHRNQIQHENLPSNDRVVDGHHEKKSAYGAFIVYIVFLACFIPNLCCIMLLTSDRSRISFILPNHISGFLVLLNSSLNPIVYCWRYREVREIVKHLLKKLL